MRGGTKKLLGGVAGAAGLAVAGAAAGRLLRHSVEARPGAGDEVALGSMHTDPITVIADDGLPLRVEVEEVDPDQSRRDSPPVTLVFAHGYALSMDSWHFQRAGYRGQIRSVFYDQRSHGESGRSDLTHATIDQLGRDLLRVLHDVTHDEPVVLVGHSMGGMSVLSLAHQFPELFGEKVVGAVLIATTAGGLDPARILFPIVPAGLSGSLVNRVVRTLSRGHRAIDAIRPLGHDAALLLTDAYSFGPGVPGRYVDFVYRMINATSFDSVASFYPAFADLDAWEAAEALSKVHTAIVCGTGDKITSIGHSRKLHARIYGSDLLELDAGGHMIQIERHQEVNEEINRVLSKAIADVAARS